ncbi:MAG TPA: ABC transporter permease [Pyrinomonadaceae bacterium]|nr:ABC transporter permease [Pyrinomonadaceae bacterium]
MAFLESVWQDLRYAVRGLRAKPLFAITALSVLALGIGINTATFSILNGFALRPLPVNNPHELVRVERQMAGLEADECCLTYPDYAYYRENNSVFSSLIAFWGPGPFIFGNGASQGVDAKPELVYAALVSGDYFQAFAGQAQLGRTLGLQDDQAGVPPVAVLNHAFWQRRFGSDPSVVGRTITIQNQPVTVVGVAAPDFLGVTPQTPDMWLTLSAQPKVLPLVDMQDRNARWLRLVGRLKNGVDIQAAQSAMSLLASRLATEYPATNAKLGVAVDQASSFGKLGGMLQVMFFLTMGAVLMVLLITCANVATLLLARASARHTEIAIRLAMGAGRARLLRQLLTENLVLWLAGGTLGLLLAYWTVKLLVYVGLLFVPEDMGVINIAVNLTPDLRVFAYTVVISVATGLLFGLAPALHATKTDLTQALKKDGSFFDGRGGRRRGLAAREYMVVAQLAVCLILLIGNGLLVRGLWRAQTLDPGYEHDHILMAEPNFLLLGYDVAKTTGLNESLRERIGGLPGVQSVAMSTRASNGRRTTIASDNSVGNASMLNANYTRVSANYFDTMSIQITRGRAFSEGEVRGNAPVAIVSEATAKRLWPGQDPLGKKIRFGKPPRGGKEFEPEPYSPGSDVIGVAKDVRSVQLYEVDPALLYVPLQPTNDTQVWLMVRTAGDPAPLMAPIRSAIENIDRGAFPKVDTLKSDLEQQMLPTRALSMIGSVLGVLGLILASLGLAGIVAFSVASRTREIGIRMAMGATPRHVIKLVLNRVAMLVVLGVVLGIIGAGILSKFMVSLLYGVNPLDPVSFGMASLFLVAIALVAAFIPARRATRIDPMIALRHD